jgi:molybdate transport system substrate-binding protein
MSSRVILAVALLAAAGCGPGPDDELVVSAAASLTDVFAELEMGFERDHPGIDVILNLGGTPTLRRQILEGAPADVFASAGRADMDQVGSSGLVSGTPRVFASNRLQIAVRRGNPTEVQGLADLADPGRLVGLCAETVPCGRLARMALDSAGIVAAVDSEEPNVRALLTKIAGGELDVGIVYETDVMAEAGVEGFVIPEGVNQVIQYLIAGLAGSSNPGAAEDFVAYLLSPAGQGILSDHGFGSP